MSISLIQWKQKTHEFIWRYKRKKQKYKKKAAVMATLKLNRLFVRNWQYYTNKQSKNNIVYGLKKKVAFLKPLARIGLKCTSWTFKVAKTKYITHRNEQIKTKSQRKSFYSYKNFLVVVFFLLLTLSNISNYPWSHDFCGRQIFFLVGVTWEIPMAVLRATWQRGSSSHVSMETGNYRLYIYWQEPNQAYLT